MLQKKSPKINGDGTYSRDFTFVENVVSANILALSSQNKDSFGKVVNIGAGGRVTILRLFNVLKDLMNFEKDPIFGDHREGDIPHSNASIELGKKLINYEPLFNFEEGIKKTLEYYLKNLS